MPIYLSRRKKKKREMLYKLLALPMGDKDRKLCEDGVVVRLGVVRGVCRAERVPAGLESN